MRRGTTLLVAGGLAALLAGCAGPADQVATTSAAAPASSTAPASSRPTSEPPSPSATATDEGSPSEEPSQDPTSTTPPEVAALQLCGTVLGLAADFVGQVAPEQLDESRTIAEQARADYADDGSGLAQKADAVLAAVEFADQTRVVTTTKAFADACRTVDPGT